MFGRPGLFELILILGIALIVFGPKKLPEIGKAIGSALRNLRRYSDHASVGDDVNAGDADQSRSDS